MPWRQTTDSYKIMVSEIMLQQTQVDRVIPKYENFLKRFPTVQDLASAQFKVVLEYWSGLGYNRRALWLQQAAQAIVQSFGGEVPQTIDELTKLKGIGPNTAAAICVYAFNRPLVFVETNIRAVFIHHFFADDATVDDKDLVPLIRQTLDQKNPRQWYWALMDYGVHIKRTHKNPARKSKHHATQSRFEGSRRQVRGQILKQLLSGPMTLHDIDSTILDELENDGLIIRDGKKYAIR